MIFISPYLGRNCRKNVVHHQFNQEVQYLLLILPVFIYSLGEFTSDRVVGGYIEDKVLINSLDCSL